MAHKGGRIRMMNNRGYLNIMCDMLVAILAGKNTKTYVMYQSNLSFYQVNFYLDKMINKGLIYKKLSDNTYHVEPKGFQFLKSVGQALECLQ